MRDPLLVVILGPTGSGKTALSLVLAERFGGETVNCDSVAVYREFDIGTAKPEAAERARVPHHLIDVVSPDQLFTAGDYARVARAALADIKARGRLPIVVGGTGLYLRALLEGLAASPQRSEALRSRLRARLRARNEQGKNGAAWLHRLLRRLDRTAAERIHPHDVPKMIRAVEVCLAARQPITKMWQQGRDPLRGFRILRIGLDPQRQLLYERLNQRAAKMFVSGLVEETAALLQKYGRRGEEIRPLSSLGYKQAAQLLSGELDRVAAIAAAQQGHRNYAKRQMTWFRREPDVHWLRGFGDEPEIQKQAVALVESERRGSENREIG
ncbi:MAG: tRNA (adenosine(37)-N6)-dimethylallyltransferase MiaA [Terriglobales bacterium]